MDQRPAPRPQIARPHIVYTMHDPRDGSPFYVGLTGALPSRMKAHLAQDVPSTAQRIAELIAADLLPVFQIAARAANWPEALRVEAHTIGRLVAEGARLTNPQRDYQRGARAMRTGSRS